MKLHWTAEDGENDSAEAHTLMLSRHGCTVCCATRERLPHDVFIEDVERGKKVEARVIYREIGHGGTFVLALEFANDENFWAVNFPLSSSAADPTR